MKIKSFNEKTVYIFGGSSGIGLSIAEKLVLLGANIIIFARNEENLKKAIRTIEKKRRNNSQILFYMAVDVSLHNEVVRVVEHCVTNYGSPDLLINCAGRACPGRFESISTKQFEVTMKINLFGIWNTVKAVLPYMKKTGGVIVNTSSVAGFLAVYGYTDYAASKFGIIGLSDALRHELMEYNISVSVLCPPDTQTPGFDMENQTKPDETRAVCEGGGLMKPEKVAERLIKGISRAEKMIIPGFSSKSIYILKRWFPGVVDSLIVSIIKKEQKKNYKKNH